VSWKSVELQVALPRTQDAGQLQDQLSKQNQRFQETLAQHQLRDEIIKRRQVREFEETIGKKVMPDDENEQEQMSKDEDADEEHSEKHASAKDAVTHPYLGQHIDFTR